MSAAEPEVRGAGSDVTEASDLALVGLLFEAGQRKQLSTDAVMEVLLEALKSGRSVEEIVEDNDVLSRRQRESIRQLLSDPSRVSSVRRSTLAAHEQFPTPVAQSGPPSKNSDTVSRFQREYAQSMPSGADRYQDGEELGRGGWGVVVRAHDRQLNRDVAVKKLTGDSRTDPDVTRRFLHEARITAQLQHPGIVPVYERGLSLTDRQPFYAMKLLEGRTLRDVISEYHALPRGRERREKFHALLLSVIDICQAIAYAHDRRIIHRDLKPTNVIIGEFGETIVVDWGLARELCDEPPAVTNDEATLPGGTSQPSGQPPQSGDSVRNLLQPAVTQHGAVIGTPSFMSPEQARGDTDAVSERSDIYALGVILYVMLTGRPPYHGDSVDATLKLVVAGQCDHPRRLDSQIPAPLASICLKAMACDPQARYESARDLASDLQSYLASEPVAAHRDTLKERVSRWCRRHPTLAAGSLISFLVISTASLLTAVMVGRAHQSEQSARLAAEQAYAAETEARQEAETAQRLAVSRLNDARSAADAWLIGLSGTLQNYPGLAPVREDLIEQAKHHYQALLDSTNNDPEQQLEAARLELRLGDLTLMSDDILTARSFYAASLKRLQSTTTDSTNNGSHREKLNASIGLTLCQVGDGSFTTDDADQLRTAVKTLTERSTEPNAEDRNSLARALLVLGRGYTFLNQNSDAVDVLESALRHAVILATDHADARTHQLLTNVRSELAEAYATTGRHADAARVLQDHIDEISRGLNSETVRPDALEHRARARMQWAATQRKLGQDWAAEAAYRGAVSDLSDAWQLMYGDYFYSENLAIAEANLGQLALQLNRLDDAEQMLRMAVDQLTGLLQSGQADRDTASRLAACNVSLGHVLVLKGNPAAEDQIKRSIDIFRYLDQESVTTDSDRLAHGRALSNLGHWYRLHDQAQAAATVLDHAIDMLQKVAQAQPSAAAATSVAIAELERSRIDDIRHAETGQKLFESAISRLSVAADAETEESRLLNGSATLLLIRSVTECDASRRNISLADRYLQRLPISVTAPAHVLQAAAIVAFRRHQQSEALALIDRAIAARRYADATDYAIRGCLLAGTDATTAALCLQQAQATLQNRPGDSRLSHWTAELEQLLQSEKSDR